MDELKELIEQKARERFKADLAQNLLSDLKYWLQHDAEVSKELGIQVMSARQAIKTLLDMDMKKATRRYGNISSVEWAWEKLASIDPEFVKQAKRKYESNNNQN